MTRTLLFTTQEVYSSHLGLDLADDGVRSVSGDDLGVVKHVELLGGIATSVQKDGLLASGVVSEELLRNVSTIARRSS